MERHRRKLLLASIGVAAVSYVSCGGDDTTPSADAGETGGGGGLVVDAGASGSTVSDGKAGQGLLGFDQLVANLMISPTTDE
jgi:hypothetical protein